jgi:hypothetical protein
MAGHENAGDEHTAAPRTLLVTEIQVKRIVIRSGADFEQRIFQEATKNGILHVYREVSMLFFPVFLNGIHKKKIQIAFNN